MNPRRPVPSTSGTGASEVFKALADPICRRLLDSLCEREGTMLGQWRPSFPS